MYKKAEALTSTSLSYIIEKCQLGYVSNVSTSILYFFRSKHLRMFVKPSFEKIAILFFFLGLSSLAVQCGPVAEAAGSSDESDSLVNTNQLSESERNNKFLELDAELYNLIHQELEAAAAAMERESAQSETDHKDRLYDEDGVTFEKRAATMAKKEASVIPYMNEQRNRELRRQQAARWDIGFGKRAVNLKGKSFMDAMYGKRSNKFLQKPTFGRKQQWDIQYGRK